MSNKKLIIINELIDQDVGAAHGSDLSPALFNI
jgi:hypothetical protein